MKIFLAMRFLLGVLGCKTKQINGEQETATTEENTSFVNAFLKLQFAQSISNGVPLVIKQRLSIGMLSMGKQEADFAADLTKQAQRQDKRLGEAVAAFCVRNTGTKTVDAIGPFSLKHVILTDKQMSELFDNKRKDGWKAFYKTYPKSPGIITLSRPGFSEDETLAVIYMGKQSHWLDGYGRIYVFEKKNGKWEDTMMMIGPRYIS